MKYMRSLLLIIITLCTISNIWAQDDYYYCNGKKLALTKQITRNKTLSAHYDKDGREMATTGYIYVKLKSIKDTSLLRKISEKYNLTIYQQDKYMPLWFVINKDKNNKESTISIANNMYETGLFAECSPDLAVNGQEISYDPLVWSQWNLYNPNQKGADINVSEAWNYSTGRNVVIAFVDEGIELTHIDLAANIYHKSYDAKNDTVPSKIYGAHGTNCAGIAAAIRNNGLLISGVAPDAKLMSISNTINIVDSLSAFNNARGINWAWKNGADIISLSWNCMNLRIVEEAIDSAITYGRNGKGCIVVKSAGNFNKPITFPGDCKGVITVANVNKYGERSRDSNHGYNMFISAPGTEITYTDLNNKSGISCGTSLAAPHVAGVAALILERNPNLTVWKVREIIAKTANKLPTLTLNQQKEFGSWSEYCGYGLVNASEAVQAAIYY